jgi:hypothetical protein
MQAEESGLEKAQRDLLWGMYVDLRTHARHAETLRANAGGLVLVVASALVALIASDKNVGHPDVPLAVVIVLAGFSGLLFSLSYTELYERNRKRAYSLRKTLDGRYFADPDRSILGLLKNSDEEHHGTAIYRLGRKRTGSAIWFWLVVPTLVTGVGVVLLYFAAR